MNEDRRKQWMDEVLTEILCAISTHGPIRNALVFKGARILCAVCELSLGEITVNAYSLHRIAGEKLRAYLTSLPAHRRKISSQPRAVRAKDLHDLARILEARPIGNEEFWLKAADEFKLACKSRLVDCEGPETFLENWDATRAAYESDLNLTSIPWADAGQALSTILDFFSRHPVFPLRFPLVQPCTGPL